MPGCSRVGMVPRVCTLSLSSPRMKTKQWSIKRARCSGTELPRSGMWDRFWLRPVRKFHLLQAALRGLKGKQEPHPSASVLFQQTELIDFGVTASWSWLSQTLAKKESYENWVIIGGVKNVFYFPYCYQFLEICAYLKCYAHDHRGRVLETNHRRLLKKKRTLRLKCKSKQLLVNMLKRRDVVERLLLEKTKRAAVQSELTGST